MILGEHIEAVHTTCTEVKGCALDKGMQKRYNRPMIVCCYAPINLSFSVLTIFNNGWIFGEKSCSMI